MLPSAIAEMLENNKNFASAYTSPPTFPQMAKAAKASGQGVIVLSCSDPRVNVHEILGLDLKISSEFAIGLSSLWMVWS